MIVVAVEHKGVENFIRDEVTHDPKCESVSIVHSWEEVQHLAAQARKILLGERITRHISAQTVVETVQRHRGCRWVFWTLEKEKWDTVLGENVEVWNRELGPDDLRHWLKPIHTLISDKMPSRWFMWSVSGTNRRQLVWKSLISDMQTYYQKGILADFDWEQALATRLWGHGSQDSHYPFARLAPVTAPWGWVIPAPMPWMPLLYEPGIEDVKRTLAHSANWMAWDLGVNIRRPSAALIIASLPAGIIYVEEPGNDEILQKGLALLKDVNARCDLWLLGESASQVAKRLRLPVLTLPTDPLPSSRSWDSLRAWVIRPLQKKM